MGGITSSSPRARTNYNIGVDNAAADDESSAGVKCKLNNLQLQCQRDTMLDWDGILHLDIRTT